MQYDLSIFENEKLFIENLYVYHGFPNAPEKTVCKHGNKVNERFFYVVSGSIVFELSDGTVLKCSKGSIVYLPSDVTYISYWDGEKCECYSIVFNLFDINNKRVSLGKCIEIVYNDEKHKLLPYYSDLLSAMKIGSHEGFFKMRSIFWNFIFHLSVANSRIEMKKEYNSIYKAVIYLENNYINDVSPEELASLCHLSVCYFRKLFKQYTGMSPIKYRNRLRIMKAKELIESGEYSITEASEFIECYDTFYFSRMFKEICGVNPSDCKPNKNIN